MKTDAVLFFPGTKWIGATGSMYPPLALIPVAGMLEESGYKTEIVDTRLEDYSRVDLNSALFVGVSAMTGRQIKHGLEVSKFVRQTHPEVPIVWGGIHASLLPEQTLESEYVDFVVKGEGEETALELAKSLEKGKSLKEIKGISYKEHGKIKHNPARPFMDLNKTPDIRYDLLKNIEAYNPKEVIHYTCSRGCPHRCEFCYNRTFCSSTWRTKDVNRILEELKWILNTFKPKRINFLEDNFFVSKKRVEGICRGVIEEKLDFEWTADCRSDYFKRYDNKFMELIKNSGCNELIIGAESGSPRILEFIKKDITVEQIENSIKKCVDHGIKTFVLFMAGFPEETKEELWQTLDLIDKVTSIDEGMVKTTISIFSPYPGTPLFDLSVQKGFLPPGSLEEWTNWNFSSIDNTPWFNEKYRNMLECIANTARVKPTGFSFSSDPFMMLKTMIRLFFSTSAGIRWKHRYFKHSYEWKLWTIIQKQRGYA